MPNIKDINYNPRWLFKNPDLNTIASAYFRKSPLVKFAAEALLTPDNDLLETQYSNADNKTLAILIHGLEGSMDSAYIQSTRHLLTSNGIDVLAFNFRNCGTKNGYTNRKVQSYHGGWTKDLAFLIETFASAYEEMFLIGYSLGGNIALKYGSSEALNPKIAGILALSTPVDLRGAALKIDEPRNKLYQQNFLRSLKQKIHRKRLKNPEILPFVSLRRIQTLYDYDDLVTAPIYGFENAEDYYKKSSALGSIQYLGVPAVLINAMDDTFLSPSSHPKDLAASFKHFTFHQTQFGGHLGFYAGKRNPSYGESLLLRYIKNWPK